MHDLIVVSCWIVGLTILITDLFTGDNNTDLVMLAWAYPSGSGCGTSIVKLVKT